MKRHIVYECETCGRTGEYDDIWKCEASHIGLTPKEMVEYTDLQEAVKIRSHIVNRSCNEDTRNELDKVIEKLVKFEEKHNINS